MIDRALLWLAAVFAACGVFLLFMGEVNAGLCFFAVATFGHWLSGWSAPAASQPEASRSESEQGEQP